MTSHCLQISERLLGYKEREAIKFHTTVEITLDGGRGEKRTLHRCRDLKSDTILIFEDIMERDEGEENIRAQSWVRIEDFASNEDGEV